MILWCMSRLFIQVQLKKCGFPILESESGLKFNVDFFVGYSPERINPGDKKHRLPNIVKVTSVQMTQQPIL